MAGLGWQELVIVLVIIMIIFGAGKLPEVARSLGQGVKEFKSEANQPVGSTAGSTAAAAATPDGSNVTVTPGPLVVDEGVVADDRRDTRADQV
jgi:sec-independent protein translocase protein TatA